MILVYFLLDNFRLDLTTVSEGSSDLIHGVLAVSEKHVSVLLEEDRVLEVRVSTAHGTLAEDNLLGTPDFDNGHAVDGAALDGLSGFVSDIVSSDNEADLFLKDGAQNRKTI